MLQGKKLRGKCYYGKNVTGENVTGENVSGENGVSPIYLVCWNIILLFASVFHSRRDVLRWIRTYIRHSNWESSTIIRPKCKATQLSSQRTKLYLAFSTLVFEHTFGVHSCVKLTKNALIQIQFCLQGFYQS